MNDEKYFWADIFLIIIEHQIAYEDKKMNIYLEAFWHFKF